MSLIYKLSRFNNLILNRSNLPHKACAFQLQPQLSAPTSSCIQLVARFTHQTNSSSDNTKPNMDNNNKTDDDRKKKQQDSIEYSIKFKDKLDVKKIFKEFYSIYGPLFVACHIGVSLTSLGFFCSLVWLTVNPVEYLPEWLVLKIGDTMMGFTEGGSKFVIAYALHKIILPARLGAAIFLTRKFAIKFKPKVDKPKQ